MLHLSDSRWAEYGANYEDGTHVATLLDRAGKGEPLDQWYDDLVQELCHQYTVSQAALPASPYLIRLAADRPEHRKHLLVLLGLCHAFVDSSTMRSASAEIVDEWRASAHDAIPLIADLLAEPQASESDLRYLLCSLAAVQGFQDLAGAIESLDMT
jgi:hypothetical protein